MAGYSPDFFKSKILYHLENHLVGEIMAMFIRMKYILTYMGMPDLQEIVDFAQICYKHERGTRKAVDEGLMSMTELTIYHYINAYVNYNMPDYYGNLDEFDKMWHQTIPNAISDATKQFQISELEAKTIFEKIGLIPRC